MILKENTITTNQLNSIAYGNNLYVTVGNNGYIATSSDKINWTQRNSPLTQNLKKVIYNGNPKRFIATGDSRAILTSEDGITWTQRYTLDTVDNKTSSDIFYDTVNSKFTIIIANQVTFTIAFMTSTDNGNTWNITSYSATNPLGYSQIKFKNLYLAGSWASGAGNQNMCIWSSTTGLSGSYTARFGELNTGCFGFAKTQDDSLVVGVFGNGKIASSTDGVTWNWRTSGITSSLIGIVYHKNIFYAFGNQGVILKSPDGVNWEKIQLDISRTLRGGISDGDFFTMVGNDGFVIFNLLYKHLIKSNNQIFTLSNNQLIDTLLVNPIETDFLSQGFDSLDTLNSSLLSTLPSSEIEILTYTDEEGAEQQAQLQSVEDSTWLDEGKLFEIVIDESKKIKTITGLEVL